MYIKMHCNLFYIFMLSTFLPCISIHLCFFLVWGFFLSAWEFQRNTAVTQLYLLFFCCIFLVRNIWKTSRLMVKVFSIASISDSLLLPKLCEELPYKSITTETGPHIKLYWHWITDWIMEQSSLTFLLALQNSQPSGVRPSHWSFSGPSSAPGTWAGCCFVPASFLLAKLKMLRCPDPCLFHYAIQVSRDHWRYILILSAECVYLKSVDQILAKWVWCLSYLFQ